MPFTALPDAVQGIDRLRREAEGSQANEKQAFVPRANAGGSAGAAAAAAGAANGKATGSDAKGDGGAQDSGSFSCYSRVGASGQIRQSKFARTKSHQLLAAVEEGTERDTGLVTTVAGDLHQPGFADGDAGEAKFNYPNAICVDGHAHDALHKPVLYVADSLNWRVRRVDTAKGKVKTVAGSKERTATDNWGAEAKFAYPSAIDVDAHGDVYVADMKAHSVRRVSASDGAVATLVATNSPAIANALDINTPEGLCIDHAGFIYITCSASDRVLRIDPSLAEEAKRVTAVAGGGVRQTFTNGPGAEASFNRPAGIAVDADDNLYVADRDNHCIRKLTKVAQRKQSGASAQAIAAAAAAPASWIVSTLAGTPGRKGYADGPAAEAQFDSPYGVAVDHQGNVFVADMWNHCIRKISQKNGAGNAVVSTVAGDQKHYGGFDGEGTGASFHLPTGICVDPTGNLFVAESAGNAIRRVIVRDAPAAGFQPVAADGKADAKADGDKGAAAAGAGDGGDAKESNGRVCSSAMPKWLQWF